MIRAILADLGYTLVYNNKHCLYHGVLTGEMGIQVSLEAVDRAFHLADKHIMRHLPGLFMGPFHAYGALYVSLVNYYLGLPLDGLACAAGYTDKHERRLLRWLPFAGVADTMSRLRGEGIRLILVTNWDESCRGVLEELGLAGAFDEVVISSEFGAEKPDPAIILRGVELAGCKREECLFVGDNYYDDGLGSRGADLDYVILNRYGSLGTEELTCDILSSFNQLPQYLAQRYAPAP